MNTNVVLIVKHVLMPACGAYVPCAQNEHTVLEGRLYVPTGQSTHELLRHCPGKGLKVPKGHAVQESVDD